MTLIEAAFALLLYLSVGLSLVWLAHETYKDPNRNLPWCKGCPDHSGCAQGMCYLDGGPVQPDPTKE